MTDTLDPSSLQGEALTRWYVRRNDEVQRTRHAIADKRHVLFFDALQPLRRTEAQPAASLTSSFNDQLVGRRAAPPATSPGRPGLHDCVSCHGRALPTPPILPKPRRPVTPLLRDAPSDPRAEPSKEPERDRKQCEIQLRRDTNVCSQQPNDAAKAVCHGTASKRYSHCRITGEIGEPDLFTIPPWPRR